MYSITNAVAASDAPTQLPFAICHLDLEPISDWLAIATCNWRASPITPLDLDPGGERRPVFPPLAPLIAQLVTWVPALHHPMMSHHSTMSHHSMMSHHPSAGGLAFPPPPVPSWQLLLLRCMPSETSGPGSKQAAGTGDVANALSSLLTDF
jgi:hypothetical protein